MSTIRQRAGFNGLFRKTTCALVLLTGAALASPVAAQQRRDPSHPDGRWEILQGCRLLERASFDADSFHVAHQEREYIFRLYFVDAPETDVSLKERIRDQAAYFGVSPEEILKASTLASEFTRAKLTGREFTVQTRWQNAMGRSSLARFYGVVIVDGKNLASELVEAGWARIYGLRANLPDGTRSTTFINQLKHLELTARAEQRGLWNTNQYPPAAAAPEQAQANPPPSRSAATNALIELNTATSAELRRLPGIGPTLAQRIIARRPYSKVEELNDVPGIGPKTMERLRPLVTVAPSGESDDEQP